MRVNELWLEPSPSNRGSDMDTGEKKEGTQTTHTTLKLLNTLQVRGRASFNISNRYTADDRLGYHDAALIGHQLCSEKDGSAVSSLELFDMRLTKRRQITYVLPLLQMLA